MRQECLPVTHANFSMRTISTATVIVIAFLLFGWEDLPMWSGIDGETRRYQHTTGAGNLSLALTERNSANIRREQIVLLPTN
jgi:hypothetical protein